MTELICGWKNEPGMFEFLCVRAVNDPFSRKQRREENPRQIALTAIIDYYQNHHQTLLLLRDRAEHDSDQKVRKFAKGKLASIRTLPHYEV
ncbi:MAG: hypothetical protein F6J90_03775 [Moorea sp. SIOASIH]|uniref:hypothetical protein n=1 Tax=Moorena sp. SIOASIH TaxID=2607817 RepID=UPI0013B76FDB|nr:hypothetical protein [Moorena sp. SIOASIH]NEO35476.1 hypothetical protein [Moorena sp. SIOASIH]